MCLLPKTPLTVLHDNFLSILWASLAFTTCPTYLFFFFNLFVFCPTYLKSRSSRVESNWTSFNLKPLQSFLLLTLFALPKKTHYLSFILLLNFLHSYFCPANVLPPGWEVQHTCLLVSPTHHHHYFHWLRIVACKSLCQVLYLYSYLINVTTS